MTLDAWRYSYAPMRKRNKETDMMYRYMSFDLSCKITLTGHIPGSHGYIFPHLHPVRAVCTSGIALCEAMCRSLLRVQALDACHRQ